MQNISRNVMNAIKMNRAELLEIVRRNNLTHVEEFQEAVEDYKKLVLQVTTSNSNLAKTGDLVQFKKMQSIPQEPVSYESSYRRAIRMLELSVDDIIEVEEDVFNQLVLDEWSWKRSFTVGNAMYKSGL